MSVERAIWYPFWYELDQSIEVGQIDDFDFFREAPEALCDETSPIFFHGGWNDTDLYYSARKRILAINHPQFGSIRSIDATGLDYTITLTGGMAYRIEAEESPGKVYELPEPITDWRIYVDIEPV